MEQKWTINVFRKTATRKEIARFTNVCPSVILEGEDYGLKVSITKSSTDFKND
jgi:hypothetical protein